MINNEHICAGIVTYNSDICLLKSVIEGVFQQVDKVYVYDNASENIEEITGLIQDYKNAELICSTNNDGIALALNTICKLAIKEGYDWILTLDHDTIIPPNMISSFIDVKNVQAGAAIVCPRVKYVNYSCEEKGCLNQRITSVEACMTSGSFMSLWAWESCGGFDEWMCIDWVDNDICKQFKLNGYEIIRDNQVFMKHYLGNPVKRKKFLIEFVDFQYSDFRLYHIIRNEIYFTRKYWKNLNIIKYACICIMTVIKSLMLYGNVPERRHTIMKAIKEGFSKQINRQ